jgi:FMN reductase
MRPGVNATKESMTASRPLIVGIGGSTFAHSSTEQALRLALASAENEGASIQIFGGEAIASLPHYLTPGSRECARGRELIEYVREADGLIIASPGYHGSISGLVKNAIDYLEETARDSRAYLDGVPVGLIATAYGWQATGSTLAALRSIVHALRGWPTPLGGAINTSAGIFEDGRGTDATAAQQLEFIGRQVVSFARMTIDVLDAAHRHDARQRHDGLPERIASPGSDGRLSHLWRR